MQTSKDIQAEINHWLKQLLQEEESIFKPEGSSS